MEGSGQEYSYAGSIQKVSQVLLGTSDTSALTRTSPDCADGTLTTYPLRTVEGALTTSSSLDRPRRAPSSFPFSEAQSKSLQERLSVTENHLGQVCEIMSSYTRKIAKMRDKGDMLSKVLKNYASLETMNPCLKRSLMGVADEMSLVQDYREAEVKRLETKVVHPLSNYGLLCKQTKNELKAAFSARDKELNQKRKLDKTKSRNPRDRGTIAEMELQKASIDASRSSKALEQQLEKFELRKLEDFKKILTDFVNVEMIFHAKALEVYTRCFSSLAMMDPEADLEEFRSHMYPLAGSDRMSMARTASLNSLSQNGTGSVEATPRHSRQGSTQGSVFLGRQISLPSPMSTPSSTRQHPPSASPSPAHTPSRRASTSSEQRSSRSLPPQPTSSQPIASTPSQPPKQGGTAGSARPASASTPAKREEARAVQPARKEEEEEDSDEYEDDDDEDDDEEEDDEEEEEEDDGISELTEVKPMSGRPIMVVSSNSSTQR